MDNGIPPFLRASPPPMQKIEFEDEDEDEEIKFDDYTTVINDFYLDSKDIITNIENNENQCIVPDNSKCTKNEPSDSNTFKDTNSDSFEFSSYESENNDLKNELIEQIYEEKETEVNLEQVSTEINSDEVTVQSIENQTVQPINNEIFKVITPKFFETNFLENEILEDEKTNNIFCNMPGNLLGIDNEQNENTVEFSNSGDDEDDFSNFVSPFSFNVNLESETEIFEPGKSNGSNNYNIISDSFCHSYLNPTEEILNNDVNDNCKTSKTIELYETCWNDIFKVHLKDEVKLNLNSMEGKLNSSSVWCKIKDIGSSPALEYNWNNSETYKMLLSTLYVDSRNILFGPRWNSEVPRFASNLGFSPLVPQKVSNENNKCSNISVNENTTPEDKNSTKCYDSSTETFSSVPTAHFDWNNSGLTNPLASYSHSSLLDLDLLASFDIHSSHYKKHRTYEEKNTRDPIGDLKFNEKDTDLLNLEAKEILNNLPNLLVMEKQYIVFPIS